jgi:hypothetical protein
MAFQIKKAERTKVKLKLAIEGPSGSGKTYSSLLIARGLVPSGRVLVVDTENESASLFSDLYEFYTVNFEPPYTPERYREIVKMAAAEKFDVLIIDSGSHEWHGKGGCLEIHDNMPGNTWTNWAKVTPRHDAFVADVLQAPIHVIMTLRSKEKYVQEEVNGKQKIRKIGAEAIQRDGLSYEFSVVLTMDISHQATSTKDRTGLFPVDTWFVPSEKTGETLREWLETGADAPARASVAASPAPPESPHEEQKTSPKNAPEGPQEGANTPRKGTGGLQNRKLDLYNGYVEVCKHPEHAKNAIFKITNGRGSKDWTELDLCNLEGDLKRRRDEVGKAISEQEPEQSPPGDPRENEPESVRDADPGIDDDDYDGLAAEKGIGPDPVKEAAEGF